MIQSQGPLDPLQLRRFEDQLLEERRRLREDLLRLYAKAAQDTPESFGEPTTRTPQADLGSEAYEQSQDLRLAEQIGRRITEIDAALYRITQWTYGNCEECGRAISIERLEAIPSASRCASCQTKIEHGLEPW